MENVTIGQVARFLCAAEFLRDNKELIAGKLEGVPRSKFYYAVTGVDKMATMLAETGLAVVPSIPER